MFYSFDLQIPANTPEAHPVSLDCPVSSGVVNRVMVIFPIGVATLAHVRVFRSSHQLWPSNLDGSFASDGEFLDFAENYPVMDLPHEFTFSGWNDDDTYAHTITLRIGITAPEPPAQPSLTDRVRAMMGLSSGG
jgi:hypothetical protein